MGLQAIAEIFCDSYVDLIFKFLASDAIDVHACFRLHVLFLVGTFFISERRSAFAKASADILRVLDASFFSNFKNPGPASRSPQGEGWWRRGELNPRPQVIRDKALHT